MIAADCRSCCNLRLCPTFNPLAFQLNRTGQSDEADKATALKASEVGGNVREDAGRRPKTVASHLGVSKKCPMHQSITYSGWQTGGRSEERGLISKCRRLKLEIFDHSKSTGKQEDRLRSIAALSEHNQQAAGLIKHHSNIEPNQIFRL